MNKEEQRSFSNFPASVTHVVQFEVQVSTVQPTMLTCPPLFRRLMPLIQTRMHVTYLTRADKIYIQNIPSPPPWPSIASFSVIQSPRVIQWNECNESKHRLSVMILDFQRRILYNRKRMIEWPPTQEYIFSKCVC